MKVPTAPVNNTTNFDGQVFQATVNSAKLSSVINLLIRNYNSAELATLREWVSNGHDSHVEAGQTKPVRVTLPNPFSPSLTVEDFGVGMSYEDVRDVYANFLTSSKDQCNEGIGGFGIGGKSALAIADQYTMVSIKDGLKNVFIFERSDTGGLDVKNALHNSPTEEPSGVKVSVAVSQNWNFSPGQINSVLEGWRENELEVINGEFVSFSSTSKEFKHGFIANSVFKFDPHAPLIARKPVLVFVGAVAYPIPDQISRSISELEKVNNLSRATDFRLALKVPIGDITFPSSREVIEVTESNTAAIVKAFEGLYKEVKAEVDAKAKNLNTIEEAYEFANSTFVKKSGIAVDFNGRKLTDVKYSGFKSFDIEHSPLNGSLSLRENKEKTYGSEDAKIIIHVDEDDASLTSETYRKYIRSSVSEIFRNYHKLHGGSYYHSFGVLLTTEKDELHPVTSTVLNFTELRKLPQESGSAVTKASPLNPKEIKSRADREWVLHVSEHLSTERILSDLLKDHPSILILSKDDDAASVAKFVTSLTDLTLPIALIRGKREFALIRKAYPELVTLEEFVNELPKSAMKLAKKRIDGYFELSKLMDISPHSFNLVTRLKQAGLLSDAALSILKLEVLELGKHQRAMGVLSTGYSTTNSSKIVNVFFGSEPRAPKYRVERKGPFSLMNSRLDIADLTELSDYLNWSANRHFELKS